MEWVPEAREKLLGLVKPGSGWGYRRDGMPSVEPTALACLALQATDPPGESHASLPYVSSAAKWLARIQQPNGAVGVSPAVPVPEWPTPYAILVWASQEGYVEEMRKATAWLLARQGNTFTLESGDIIGYDTNIAGWPWVAGTSPWLEPTAMAILALRRQGLAEHARTREGLRLIRDRAIATGGWNMGANSIYGKSLRPMPAETGIALMTIKGTEGSDVIADKACSYLLRTLPRLRSAQSLCWGLLGLTAWSVRPPDAEQWIAEAFSQSVSHSDLAPQLAYLLLASSERSLFLLGAKPNE